VQLERNRSVSRPKLVFQLIQSSMKFGALLGEFTETFNAA
jgi:hypothetical protein